MNAEDKNHQSLLRAQLMLLAFSPRPQTQHQRDEMATLFFAVGSDEPEDVIWEHV